MRGRSWVCAAAAAAVCAAAASASACEGRRVLFEDRFATHGDAWGAPDTRQFVDGGRLVVKPPIKTVHPVVSGAGAYPDVDLCADVIGVETVDPNEAFGGLVFWYVDADNYFAFETDVIGQASVWRRLQGEWHNPVPWRETALLKKGEGAVNRLRVVTKMGTVKLYINDELFVELASAAPFAQRVGVLAASPPNGIATFAFSDLVVTAPD